MKKLFSYFQHSILIMFVVLAGILSCEELEDGIANSISDTVSVFDTVSVSDTVSILDTLFMWIVWVMMQLETGMVFIL